MLRRLRRSKRSAPGRMGSIGQDHNAGHRSYVSQLPPETREWLYTKPFNAPPNYELARCLRSFAHIVESLDLSLGSHVLDVGCGPGWISEWLLRCGYRVTGIDISEEMVGIAEERAAKVGVGADSGPSRVEVEFHAVPVQEMAWAEEFDAAILYDAMHHFDDEMATLQAIQRALVPGGQIYIHEGVRPPPGSAAERELIEEMERFGTLEAPFDPDYLVEVVESSGFVDVQRLVEVDALLPAARPNSGAARVRRQLQGPTTNTLIADKPLPGSPRPTYRADLELLESRTVGDQVLARIAVANTGSRRWKAGASTIVNTPGANTDWVARRPSDAAPGCVNIGPVTMVGDTLSYPQRAALPQPMKPGDRVETVVAIDLDEIPPGADLYLDLVHEHVAWFADIGGARVAVPFERNT